MYLLRDDLIEWPDEFETNMVGTSKALGKKQITYDKDNKNIKIKIKDLMFIYDLPNGNHDNIFETKSRLDGLHQTLENTSDSLIAKNIILRTNGKELITGSKDGLVLSSEEKQLAEDTFFSNYGLSKTRKRGIITKAKLDYKSLHIALRDLGLDESVKVDGNLIYTALHIPKDIISLEAKKTTYNNFKESMVSYVQNEMQASLNSLTAAFQKFLDDNSLKVVGSYEHLPIMQFILLERYEGVLKRATALQACRNAGLPDEIALELTGFDKTLTLTELPKPEENGEDTEEETEEQKIRRLIG